MERLLEYALAIGARKEHLVAKVFGGAHLLSTSSAACPIGARNIELAMNQLEDWRIKVLASDLGGRVGRKVIMNTMTGVVLLGRGRPQK